MGHRIRFRGDAVAAHGNRPCRVFTVKNIYQSLESHCAGGHDLVDYFVAGAPDYNAGMVPVAVNKIRDIVLRPFIEINPVSVVRCLRFRFFPLVVYFIHYQKTHFIAQIHEFRRIRIMRRPDGVAAHCFQFFQPPFPDPFRYCRAHRAGLVMQADPVQFHLPAV